MSRSPIPPAGASRREADVGAGWLPLVLVVGLAAPAALAAPAQDALPDPTRPPPGYEPLRPELAQPPGPDLAGEGEVAEPVLGLGAALEAGVAALSTGEGGRDEEAAPPPPTVQMTLVGPRRSRAIIDGQLVEPGDTVAGAQVRSLRPDAVVLRSEDAESQILEILPKEGMTAAGDDSSDF